MAIFSLPFALPMPLMIAKEKQPSKAHVSWEQEKSKITLPGGVAR